MVFDNPKAFLLLLVLLPVIFWYVKKWRSTTAAIQVSDIKRLTGVPTSSKIWLRHLAFALQMLALVLIIIALARPQSTNRWKNVTSEGIDIVITLDISGSMLAADFKPNRLEAAKDVGAEFIAGRPNDRIGLVVFAAESFTQCPLTTDHATLLNLMKNIKMGMIDDGTAIGMGLATAVNRLRNSKSPSKVIILLTDGVNNQGSIAPMTAAEIAKAFGIRVYTIGVGTRGMAPYPVQTPFGTQYQDMEVEIDEPLLQQIAQLTGGKYFRATNNQKLREIYKEIDRMEKTRVEIKEYKKREEEFFKFGMAAFILLLGSFAIRQGYMVSLP
ncbi:MAG TPA: VWA domain-containing protein [Bacteroidales bacterium]|nr:VWA domain-containing protein [Bacteroidales bacterium]HOK97653.1 VWA domain-containing protein [Bacteroidales bacterium]HPO64802.1 VWA domain-containing protein [Bacteroidales bacterium]